MKKNELFTEKSKGYLVTNESNVTYMSGFTGEAAWLLLSKDCRLLMTDGRYDEQASQECPDFEVIKWLDNKRYSPNTLASYLKKHQIKTLVFNGNDLSYQVYEAFQKYFKDHALVIEMESETGVIEQLRAVKDEEEISKIKKACQIADQALEATIEMIKPGVSELEIVASLEYHMKMLGAENISFDTIVLSGLKTSLPHGKPSQKKLEKGDFLQLDFGALYKGYHSDMSRTFIIGEASDEQVKIYEMMKKATQAGIEALAEGVSVKAADQAVRELLGTYEKYYYPGLGHGVGLDVHELPYIGQSSKDQFEIGQVVTIEPGIYIPGYGGMRIEDTVVIREEGYEILTHYPRELQILK